MTFSEDLVGVAAFLCVHGIESGVVGLGALSLPERRPRIRGRGPLGDDALREPNQALSAAA